MNNFTLRILSGSVMIALIVSLLFVGGHIGVYILANIIGIYSIIEFFKLKNISHKLIVLSNVGFFMMVLFTVVAHFPYFNFTNVNKVVLLFLGYLILLLGIQWYFRKQISEAVQWFAHVYITLPLITFILIPTQGFVFPFNPETDFHPHLGLMLFVLVWSSDSWAYVAGKLLGKHKLAPTISPGKTWEGFIGGAILTAATSWAFNNYILSEKPLLSSIQAIVLGLLIATFGTLGDLFQSSLKRKAGVKDSGTIIPGHGGMLDRFDAFLFASVVMFIIISL